MAETTQIVFQVKGDASHAIAEIEKLGGKISDFKSKSDNAGRGFAGLFDGIAGGLAKFNLALGGLQKGVELLGRATGLANFASEMERLNRVVPIVALETMRRATRGTVADVHLLGVAIRAVQGDFRLTTAQLDVTMRAAQALHDRGFGPTVDIAKRLIEALGEKSVAKLDDFGIALEVTKNKTADNAKAFAAFQKVASSTGPFDVVIDRTDRMQANWANAMAEMKRGLGGLVRDLLEIFAPAIRAMGGIMSEWLNTIYAGIDRINGQLDTKDTEGQRQSARETAIYHLQKKYEREGFPSDVAALKAATSPELGEEYRRLLAGIRQLERERRRPEPLPSTSDAALLADLTGGKDGGKDGGKEYRAPFARVIGESEHVRGVPIGGIFRTELAAISALSGSLETLSEWRSARREERAFDVGSAREREGQEYQYRSALASALGYEGIPSGIETEQLEHLADIMGQLRDPTEAAGAAMMSFTSALAAGVDAAIASGDGIATAMAKAASASLRATAVEASVKALWESAQGIAAAAVGSPTSAAHFAAAAKFAATAIAAGAGSALLGTLGPSSAGAGAGALGGYASGGAGGGYISSPRQWDRGTDVYNIYISDGAIVDDPHRLAIEVQRRLSSARRSGRLVDSPPIVTRA